VSRAKTFEPNKSKHTTCASSFIWLEVWESQVGFGSQILAVCQNNDLKI